MRLSDVGEMKLLERLRDRFPSKSEDVLVGIGDDAAIINIYGKKLLLSTDTMAEGVHFDLAFFTPYQVAYKLIALNVSDIFAMGGNPKWSLLNLALPSDSNEEFFEEFLQGLSDGMNRYGVELIGGDITASCSLLTISLTIVGLSGKKIIQRSGASIGDRVYLSGPTGEAACGLELLKSLGRPVKLERGEKLSLLIDWESIKPLLKRFLLPEARDLSRYLDSISSMIDISDGLFLDLSRLCKESSIGVRLYEEKIPITNALWKASSFLNIDPYILITSGGEDYQQLFTARESLPEFIEIGEIIEQGMYIVKKDGSEVEIKPSGYVHFVS